MRPVHPFAAFLLLVAAPLVAQEKVDFARDVQPILSRSCYECHGNPATDLKGPSKRPKGNLRLDGKSYMLERHGEAVLTAGKPASSLLYELIALPKGDPDLMPPEGGPLKADEQALIRRWIEEGADFGAWEGNKPGAGQSPVPAAAPAPVTSSRSRLYEELGRGLEPLPADRLAAAAGGIALIEAVAQGSGLYRVAFSAHEAEVDDAAVKRLATLGDRIVELRLGRSRVTDKALALIAGMERLARLDLRETAVGDAGLAKLAGAKELRYLNLFGTKVSDAGLPLLVELPRLESVYLWRTAVSEDAVAVLRKRLPKLSVVTAPRLPANDEEEPAPRRRRQAN